MILEQEICQAFISLGYDPLGSIDVVSHVVVGVNDSERIARNRIDVDL